MTSTTSPDIDLSTLATPTCAATTNTVNHHEVWGFYKTVDVDLFTHFRFCDNFTVDITDVYTDQDAWFPHTINSYSSSIVTDNALDVKSRGTWTIQGQVIPGAPLTTWTLTLTTTINWYGSVDHTHDM